ncbi:Transmembrane protein 161A, partial [Larimichthys crocea]
ADGNPAGGQLAGCQHYAEDGSALFVRTLAPLQWQSVPVQTPVRRRAVRAGREADAQTEQERQETEWGEQTSHCAQRHRPSPGESSRKTLHTLMSHYFRSEEGGERSVCLAFGFLSLLVAMLVLVVREDYLEFGLESGFSSLFDNLEIFAKQQGYADWSIPVTKLTVKLGLAAVCAYIGSLLAFPGLRLAQTHLDAVQMNSDRPLIQILLHMSFLSPVVVLILWVKPIARDFLANAPMGKTSITIVSSAAFDSMRLWIIVAMCALRLALTRYHMQAYLNLAQKWVEQMKKEAGRIAAIDIQRKVTRIFCYLTVITLQYLVPIFLILFSTLALKALGDFSWQTGAEETPGVTPALVMPTAAPVQPGGLDEDEEGGG